MPFVVESGAGLSNANSYVSVADADDYHTLRNNTGWDSLSDEVKQASLLYATSHIDARYSWPGYVGNVNQSLGWPRTSAYDKEGRILSSVPQKLKDAVCELALIHATTEAINSTFERGGAIKAEQVGPVSVEYFDGAPSGVTYPFLDGMLSTITVTGSVGVIKLSRS